MKTKVYKGNYKESKTQSGCQLNYSYVCDHNRFSIRQLHKNFRTATKFVKHEMEWTIWSVAYPSATRIGRKFN